MVYKPCRLCAVKRVPAVESEATPLRLSNTDEFRANIPSEAEMEATKELIRKEREMNPVRAPAAEIREYRTVYRRGNNSTFEPVQ